MDQRAAWVNVPVIRMALFRHAPKGADRPTPAQDQSSVCVSLGTSLAPADPRPDKDGFSMKKR